jgi:hypothetical protein
MESNMLIAAIIFIVILTGSLALAAWAESK